MVPLRDRSQAGVSPVWVTPSEKGVRGTGKAFVRVTDRAAAERAGVQGLLLSVRPIAEAADGVRTKVTVDVSTIAGAFGGDWLSRARLVQLPECALSTPERAECRAQTPLATAARGDRSGLLSADVALDVDTGAMVDGQRSAAGGTTVLAATAAPAGPAGTYTATSLTPSGTWSNGGSTGGFSWSYPIDVPEGLGGTKPNIALSYSSQSVDGRTVVTNNQASWIGEGWNYSPGFVERRFKPCSKDGREGSNEQCLAGHNAVFSLNGKSSTLVRDDASGTWRLENDDASKAERLTGAANGDNNGEYWKITTADGTQYYFGAGRKPGSTTAPATNSTWTTPAYGNNAGEECHQSTFEASWCQQAWRWNLDFVVDPRGGVITHWYDQETNHYKRGATAAKPDGTRTSYIRGGTLARITYGSKLTDADTVKPTAQVFFTTAERCLPDAAFDCAPAKLTKTNATKWPDVPFDQSCTAAGTCENTAATFWTTKRLTTITTQVRNAAGGYDNVDSYALKHEFPDPKDGTAPALWLASLTHTGFDGAASLSAPPVTFAGRLMNNRVDSSSDNKPALNRRRVVAITSETGQVTDIGYADPDCAPGAGLPPAKDSNGTRCYPVYWNPDDKSPLDPTLDWFHKYVISRVTEIDPFGGSRPREVRYEYVGPAAWHRDDDELTEAKHRTWNQFRGYEQVITRAGTAPDVVSKSAAFYLRGMNGDVKADGSKRTVTYPGLAGNTLPDDDALAGTVRETRTFASDQGEPATVSRSEPWLSAATATRSRGAGLPALTARMQRPGASQDRSLRADGTWQTTSRTTTYDSVHGMPTEVLVRADGLPDVCTTTTYARNTAAWMMDRVSETVQIQGNCGATPAETNTLARNRTTYDGRPHGTLDGPGLVTTTESLDRFDSGRPVYTVDSTTVYDAYGRATSTTDAAGAKTTTVYEPATLAVPITTKVTNAKGWTTTTTLHPLRGLSVKTADHNGRTTEASYDALGRTTGVWMPGRTRDMSANTLFTYDLTNTTTSAVTTRSLRSDQSYATSIAINDAFGQQVQLQSVAQNGAATSRLITDTAYDSHGRAAKTNQMYVNHGSAPAITRFVADDGMIPAQTATLYDGLGRPTASVFLSKGQEQWRTTTAYPGAERTDILPPMGDTATSVITDVRGRTVERRTYKGGKAEGEYDSMRYAYSTTGELTRLTDAAGNAWTYAYDLRGRRISSADPDKGAATTTYDHAGRPASTRDALGTTVFISYDILGRPTSRNLNAADGPKLATYEYDTLLLGQPTATVSWTGGKPWRQEATGYDIGYRPTGTKLTVPEGEGALTGTYTLSTSYDPVTGLERRTTLPAVGGLPSERLEAGRNINGLPVSYGSDTTDYVNFIDYDEHGTAKRTTFGDVPKQVSVTNIQDPATGRLLSTRIDKQDQTTPVETTGYTYTQTGDVTSVESTQGAVRDLQCFTYDHLHRLTRAWTDTDTVTTRPGPSVPGVGGCARTTPRPGATGGPAPYDQAFTYDITGNRTSVTDHDPAGDPTRAGTTTTSFPAPGSARPHAPATTTRQTGTGPSAASPLTYDANGNTLTRPDGNGSQQSLTWDVEGRLVANATSAGTSTYVYDASGTRLLRKDPGRTTLTLGSTELTLDTTTNKVTGTRYYATPGGPTIVRTSEGKLSYVVADHHNTGTVAVDAVTLQVQRRYTKPFGEQRGSAPITWPGQKGFVGGTQDKATGLTHLGARTYDPRTGTFLSVDPVLTPGSSQSLNAYAYAHNNPITTSDPSGLCAELDCPTRACATCRNSTPGHAPRPGDDQPGSGSGNPKARSGAGAHYGNTYRPSPVGGKPLNCSMSRNGCGGPKPPAPPTPLPAPPWLPPPPPVFVPSDCRPDDGRVACMTEVSPSQIRSHPFNKGNVDNDANELAYWFAAKTESCAKRAEQYVCFGKSPAGDQPITVGDVHFYPSDKESFARRINAEARRRDQMIPLVGAAGVEKFGPDLERHEAIHSKQWARSERAEIFIIKYFKEVAESRYKVGTISHANDFEKGANLWWGGYLTWRRDQFIAPGEELKFSGN
ncbi:RHS repeat-associated core domain-containing protein [Streptomyces sp. NPDC057939]|uniref:RHS repeat domain-containing protein n=1 Tax=Streptomyces sp. NPDC057939 TaxID=3346284 RepID=UPI0036EFD166